MDKELMLLDQIEEIRQKALEEPQNYPIDNTIRLITAKVADYLGFESRNEWTKKLKNHTKSKYETRLAENNFHL